MIDATCAGLDDCIAAETQSERASITGAIWMNRKMHQSWPWSHLTSMALAKVRPPASGNPSRERCAETIERALEDASIERAPKEASRKCQRISPQVALLLAAGASALKTPCPLYAPTSPRVCTLAMG